ncbi:hypothetical protein NBO_2g0053 [Nosema bombycis CQ1]|uniref:Uncharacterized protein n=1 Tax=Nosema bombycis (strain CQ1 / CVCC 102059) TaxID=578461 RepID=R0KXD4_NOSB1|nr:hypothetical protein NBO_2g0053 [Nosema bombycis CQ1]|eukprot:EOB15561.1 hypothetical protein NBO_2g0053 [Nosema bombycis CQ1]
MNVQRYSFSTYKKMQTPIYRHHLKTRQINLYETCIKDMDIPFKCKTITEQG